MLEGGPVRDHIVLLGNIYTHAGNDSVTWRGVTGRNSLPDLILCSILLLLASGRPRT